MPIAVERVRGNRYKVFNEETGQVHAKSTTLANAKKQMRLLNAIDHGFVPTKKVSGNAWVTHVKNVAADRGISYFQALKVAGKSYKGAPSKTHKGEKDFTTKKTSKVFHEGGHYVRKGRKPFRGGAVPAERGLAAEMRQIYQHGPHLDQRYRGKKIRTLLNNVVHQSYGRPLYRVDITNDDGSYRNTLLNPFDMQDLRNIQNILSAYPPSYPWSVYNHLANTKPNFSKYDIPPQMRGGALPVDLKTALEWYIQKLKNIKEGAPASWDENMEGDLQDLIDVYNMAQDDNVDIDPELINELLLAAQSTLNLFERGYDEMKY